MKPERNSNNIADQNHREVKTYIFIFMKYTMMIIIDSVYAIISCNSNLDLFIYNNFIIDIDILTIKKQYNY